MSERLEDRPAIADHVSMTVSRDGKVVGFNESQGRGRAAHGTIDEQGSASFGISGSPSHGEDGTLETSALFIRVLNSGGARWQQPNLISEGLTDALSCSLDDNAELRMQVVRAVSEPAIWKALGCSGSTECKLLTPAQIADLLRDSISRKVLRIHPTDRADLVLLLNALDTPIVCFDQPISVFLSEHGLWAAGLGFRGIWVIGPWPSLVRTLAGA